MAPPGPPVLHAELWPPGTDPVNDPPGGRMVVAPGDTRAAAVAVRRSATV